MHLLNLVLPISTLLLLLSYNGGFSIVAQAAPIPPSTHADQARAKIHAEPAYPDRSSEYSNWKLPLGVCMHLVDLKVKIACGGEFDVGAEVKTGVQEAGVDTIRYQFKGAGTIDTDVRFTQYPRSVVKPDMSSAEIKEAVEAKRVPIKLELISNSADWVTGTATTRVLFANLRGNDGRVQLIAQGQGSLDLVFRQVESASDYRAIWDSGKDK